MQLRQLPNMILCLRGDKMDCKKCGMQNDDDSKFCKNCGASLIEDHSNEVANEEETEHQSSGEKCESGIVSYEPEVSSNINSSRNAIVPSKKKTKKVIAIISAAIILIVLSCIIYNATKCKHEWIEADCTTPKTCSICEKTKGKPLGHEWKEATCENPKTCTRCGETEGSSLGHDFKDATCTEARKCSRCGETDGEPLGHDVEDWKIIKDSTCSEVGKKEGTCVRCGEKVTGNVKKKAHQTGKWQIEKEATLERDGKRYKICSVCKQKVNEESYSLSKAERLSAYKTKCGTYSYKEIARNPDKYEGKYMKFTGKVVQVQEAESFLYYSVYRISVTNNGYGYYDDTVYVTCDNYGEGDRILEDDIVTFYGECKGVKTYETVMGANITIPWVEAEFIELN